MPIVVAEAALASFRSFGQRSALRTVVENNLIAVLRKNSFGGALNELFHSCRS